MPDRLREFVYLNTESVNSHLSSLGKAIPVEVTDSEESVVTNEGKLDLQVVEGGRDSETSKGTQTQRDATAPFRFEELLQSIEEEDIEIHENPDPRAVVRGDIVRISGEFVPMSLYKLEVLTQALLDQVETFEDPEFFDDLDEFAEGDSGDEIDIDLDETPDDSNIRAVIQLIALVQQLTGKFIGDSVPIRIDSNSGDAQYATKLDRSKFRKPPSSEFINGSDFVLFGRVEQAVSRNDEWNPIDSQNIVDTVSDESIYGEEIEQTVRSLGTSLNMEVSNDDITVPGHTAEIHSLAVYW